MSGDEQLKFSLDSRMRWGVPKFFRHAITIAEARDANLSARDRASPLCCGGSQQAGGCPFWNGSTLSPVKYGRTNSDSTTPEMSGKSFHGFFSCTLRRPHRQIE